ncbi:GGDEF domain-containing protein [Terriglobus roseus]|uniref:diguanylate cyclase n=1 Tax=Terriglobus roseus TaxID=392734 RepID=A0A1H4TD94_9BACT|nr:GGDEF domain-containing protein [Terriglobus roseus]SEC54436.1 diguanylate cyclase (GGDEF) domain-containing protein [Terriglobus roseus]
MPKLVSSSSELSGIGTSKEDDAQITGKQLNEEIRLLDSGGLRWLSHIPTLEAHFETTTAAQRSRRFWMLGIVCIFVFNFFLISDYLFSPAHFLHAFVVRACIATPPTILAVVFLRRGVSKAVREGMAIMVCAIFALCSLDLYFNVSPVVSTYAMTSMAILVLFTNIGIRVRLPYAIFAAVMCLLFGIVYLLTDSTLKNPEKFQSFSILLAAAVLSLVSNYTAERGERLNFLHRIRIEANFGALVDANDQLLILSREDKLTGMANRGHFDETYKRAWAECAQRGAGLSIIMIDIDNFKSMNDRYGHPYGDLVIQRVALLLKQSLRNENDFVARYGGEEFVVMLPNAAERVALHVAQRIRLLVEVAGSPPVSLSVPSEGGWGTVSCGVSTAWPRHGMNRNDLIARADLALYRAKADGRNRVSVDEQAA